MALIVTLTGRFVGHGQKQAQPRHCQQSRYFMPVNIKRCTKRTAGFWCSISQSLSSAFGDQMWRPEGWSSTSVPWYCIVQKSRHFSCYWEWLNCILKREVELSCINPQISEPPLFYPCVHFSPPRRIYYYDSTFSSQKENRLFCHPDIPSLHYDCDLITSVVLAEQRICPCSDCLWWVPDSLTAWRKERTCLWKWFSVTTPQGLFLLVL